MPAQLTARLVDLLLVPRPGGAHVWWRRGCRWWAGWARGRFVARARRARTAVERLACTAGERQFSCSVATPLRTARVTPVVNQYLPDRAPKRGRRRQAGQATTFASTAALPSRRKARRQSLGDGAWALLLTRGGGRRGWGRRTPRAHQSTPSKSSSPPRIKETCAPSKHTPNRHHPIRCTVLPTTLKALSGSAAAFLRSEECVFLRGATCSVTLRTAGGDWSMLPECQTAPALSCSTKPVHSLRTAPRPASCCSSVWANSWKYLRRGGAGLLSNTSLDAGARLRGGHAAQTHWLGSDLRPPHAPTARPGRPGEVGGARTASRTGTQT